MTLTTSLSAIRPAEYEPLSPEQFIGDAATVARKLQTMASRAIANNAAPLKLLINGEPGIGKSALVKFVINLLQTEPKWSVRKYNGTQVKIEIVEELASTLHYRDMYSLYRVIWIDEADKIPSAAQVRFLTLLDDLPNGNAVICTSNCQIEQFEKRFQTRFQTEQLNPPSIEQIARLLRNWLDPKAAASIASCAAGNVRAALLDAESTLQIMPAAA